jgi:hypothetical protein
LEGVTVNATDVDDAGADDEAEPDEDVSGAVT